jgi:hypothetical protein
MERIRIRDGKNSDLGPGINIPDPQHRIEHVKMADMLGT